MSDIYGDNLRTPWKTDERELREQVDNTLALIIHMLRSGEFSLEQIQELYEALNIYFKPDNTLGERLKPGDLEEEIKRNAGWE